MRQIGWEVNSQTVFEFETDACGRLLNFSPVSDATALESASLPRVGPAFFDIQINGAMGIDFTSPELTPDAVEQVCQVLRSHGVGRFFPTLITAARTATDHGLRTITQAIKTHPLCAEMIAGIHLEGPYLSAEDGPRGAHPAEYIRPADIAEFQHWQQLAQGRIRLVTIAPECPNALPFIDRLKSEIRLAIGHTAATPEQLAAAVAAGATLSTHLGNGLAASLPRHANPLLWQLAQPSLACSFIPDGFHIPQFLVDLIRTAKSAAPRIITCDASPLAGLPPATYTHWGKTLEVHTDGRVTIPGSPYLAGSGVFTDSCVANMVRQTGISWQEAWAYASTTPAEFFGLPPLSWEVGSAVAIIPPLQ